MAKHALVVDDSPAMREIVTLTLESAGFQTHAATNGLEGLDRLKGQSIDVIVTDLNMPVMDGLEFIEHVRSIRKHRGTPILLLTTETDGQLKRKGRQAGATGWLVKPFKPERLLQIVAQVVR